MKLFTVEEANAMLPALRPKLEKIREIYGRIDEMRALAKDAAQAAEYGGGMERGPEYVRALYQVGKLTTEIHKLGVEMKDYHRGLIDFPSRRGDRVVLLCWQLGEDEKIAWWHDIDAGFAGRQPL